MVVEEISMFSGEFLDRLSNVVSRIRALDPEAVDDSTPFGGIQLILCGDFLQLPPIPKKERDICEMKEALARKGEHGKEIHCDRGFAFQSLAWRNAELTVVELDHVFRQKDATFQDVLHQIRKGSVSSAGIQFLAQCNRPLPPSPFGVVPTVLYARNKNVDSENRRELEKIPGQPRSFQAEDSVVVLADGSHYCQAEASLRRNHFFGSCIAEKNLQLKVGAQVMLLKNEQPVAGEPSIIGSHKKNRLVNGSRGVVVEFDEDEEESYPVVQFVNGITKTIRPEKFESKLAGLGICRRMAIPLKLAWAVTIHKSQGLTLDYVKADVSEVFTEAQAYVALSRATDEKGLELRGFSKGKVRADWRALAFYSAPNKSFPCWNESWEKDAASSY